VLASSIASTYSQLATEYALHAVLKRTVAQRELLQNITADRVKTGLDTQIERNQSRGSSADARAQLVQSEGQIILTKQQLGALIGKGPDRGLQITEPQMHAIATPALPQNLPLNLLGRRPDIVAARWKVEAATKGIDVAKARFYPDINISASVGFDTLMNANPFTAASKSIAFGPAISLPIFEGGALRANLKGEYASYDLAVGSYNQTLNDAYGDVARQITAIRFIDRAITDPARGIEFNHACLRSRQGTLSHRAGLATGGAQRRNRPAGTATNPDQYRSQPAQSANRSVQITGWRFQRSGRRTGSDGTCRSDDCASLICIAIHTNTDKKYTE